eukprot:scaffold892_cov54-Phaeocystis_antarctica.AAC.1
MAAMGMPPFTPSNRAIDESHPPHPYPSRCRIQSTPTTKPRPPAESTPTTTAAVSPSAPQLSPPSALLCEADDNGDGESGGEEGEGDGGGGGGDGGGGLGEGSAGNSNGGGGLGDGGGGDGDGGGGVG